MYKLKPDEVVSILYGDRTNFREHIRNILKVYGELKNENIDKLTTPECMTEFNKAFTTFHANNDENYDFYEILGDSTANNCIVWYFQRRFFPDIKKVDVSRGTMRSIAILSRLKQEGASTKQFSKFANRLNLIPYITMTDVEKRESVFKISEDVFEAFLGCLVYHCDLLFRKHIGFSVVYNILEKLFDAEEIKIDEEKLYDAKSLLNNDATKLKNHGIMIEYISNDLRSNPELYAKGTWFNVKIVIKDVNFNKILLSSSEYNGKNTNEMKQRAAKEILEMENYKELKKYYLG
jgi:dsRNA-specific ribonuclease